MRLRTLVTTGMLCASVACAPRGPVIDTGGKPEGVGGTIAGTVRTSPRSEALPGRKVTAINEATGTRIEGSTGTNGGYTIKVPSGKYRLELELQPGEALEESPEPTDVNVGDLDPDRN